MKAQEVGGTHFCSNMLTNMAPMPLPRCVCRARGGGGGVRETLQFLETCIFGIEDLKISKYQRPS